MTNLYSSGDVNVAIKITNLKATAGSTGYTFDFAVDKNDNLSSLEIYWGKERLILDKKNLPHISNPILQRIRFLVDDHEPDGQRSTLIVVIPYKHNRFYFGINRKPIDTICAARLYFLKENLAYWEICEPVKDEPEKWKFSSYDVKTKKLLDEGIKNHLLNPYARFDYNKLDW
jgi:hypothetical protein